MKLVTPDQMKEIDRTAIKDIGIPGTVLMENAGLGLYEIVRGEIPGFSDSTDFHTPPSVGIVCGTGNNGGDGFVLARHLLNNDVPTEIFLLGKTEEIKGDARTNLNILLNSGNKITEITTSKDITSFRNRCSYFGLLVDGIFGTGFKGQVKGIPEQAIKIMNDSDIPILAVDVPSGMNANTGGVQGTCVQADFTGTMCLPKRGLFLYPGKDYAGDTYVIDIGVPPYLWQDIALELTEPLELSDLLPFRPDNSNKGTFGRVFVLAGSTGMTGAASLTSLSTLKVGAGLVRLGVPESLNSMLESKATEAITVPLPETTQGTIASAAMGKIQSEIKNAAVVVIGPGLSTHKDTRTLLEKLVPTIKVPLVIDADGLNNLTPKILKGLKAPAILTPHPGELSRLTGLSISDIQKARVDVTCEYAKKWNLTLVLKGAPTIIASGGTAYLNPTYTSALAKAGSGDVLTGLIGGLLAQGLLPVDAARLGVYLHGKAGELAAEKLTDYSPLASDIMDLIPETIKELLDL
jgi:NAD(P)H-hydrate epimerase